MDGGEGDVGFSFDGRDERGGSSTIDTGGVDARGIRMRIVSCWDEWVGGLIRAAAAAEIRGKTWARAILHAVDTIP